MDVAELNSKCVSREQESEYLSKSCYCLLYKRTRKERRKGNPPTPTTLSLYTIRLPPSNHSPCSDVPSESYPMILHTTPSSLIVTTTPHRLTSQHLKLLLYLTKLSRHPLAAFPRVFQRLRLPLTQFLRHHKESFIAIPKYPYSNLCRDKYLKTSYMSSYFSVEGNRMEVSIPEDIIHVLVFLCRR